MPNHASTAIPAAVSSATVCAQRISRRRFTRSASAPAGSANRKSGRLDIVCISETIVAEPVSVVIVHTAAVSFIVVPMLETMLPSHSARNSGKRSGDEAEDIPETLESITRPVQRGRDFSSSTFHIGRSMHNVPSSPMDVFTPEKRSEVMSRIRGRDTKPELALRSLLHRAGYRFTVAGPKNKSLPGRPDIVLPKYRTVIFVHGCFWHGHENCPAFRLPKSRLDWWRAKIDGNRTRDLRNENALRALGWHVVTVWECALKTTAARQWLTNRLPKLLG